MTRLGQSSAGLASLVTPAALRMINKLGGRHGEYAASFFLDQVAYKWAPATGVHRVQRNGLHWELDLGDNLQRRLYLVGAYESLTLATILPDCGRTTWFSM